MERHYQSIDTRIIYWHFLLGGLGPGLGRGLLMKIRPTPSLGRGLSPGLLFAQMPLCYATLKGGESGLNSEQLSTAA